jgi:putative transposase
MGTWFATSKRKRPRAFGKRSIDRLRTWQRQLWVGDALDACDNAPNESIWGRLKVGRLHGRKLATRRQAMDEVIDWLAFYNLRRLRSTLGHLSPRKYEERWVAAKLNKAA